MYVEHTMSDLDYTLRQVFFTANYMSKSWSSVLTIASIGPDIPLLSLRHRKAVVALPTPRLWNEVRRLDEFMLMYQLAAVGATLLRVCRNYGRTYPGTSPTFWFITFNWHSSLVKRLHWTFVRRPLLKLLRQEFYARTARHWEVDVSSPLFFSSVTHSNYAESFQGRSHSQNDPRFQIRFIQVTCLCAASVLVGGLVLGLRQTSVVSIS